MDNSQDFIEVPEEGVEPSKVDRNISLKIYKDYKISIYKPLIPLKLALFFWFGAGSIIVSFLSPFVKYRGLTLAQLSVIYMLSPAIQFLIPMVFGVVADKMGRFKPILIINLIGTIAVISCLLVTPKIETEFCNEDLMNVKYHDGRLVAVTSCNVAQNTNGFKSCEVDCSSNETIKCNKDGAFTEMLKKNYHKISIQIDVNDSYKSDNVCYYSVDTSSCGSETYFWCNEQCYLHCNMSCVLNNSENCSRGSTVVILYFVLLLLFFLTFPNVYRFYDIAAMTMVKDHNSDYGHERFWSILGSLVFPPLAGYVVDATTAEGYGQNYDAAYYVVIVLSFLTLSVTWMMDVQVKPPGKRMWKKSIALLKNPDIFAFTLVVFVLGTTWGFAQIFTYWFIGDLGSPAILVGLVKSVNSLYGLPFLLTSNWWINKIGTTNTFVLALLGYAGSCFGYSLLHNPWMSLLLEATSILNYHLLWVAVMLYCHKMAPDGLKATVNATAGGLHFNFGRSSGSLIGGLVMSAFGGRTAHRLMGGICLVSAAFYAMYLYVRHKLNLSRLRSEGN